MACKSIFTSTTTTLSTKQHLKESHSPLVAHVGSTVYSTQQQPRLITSRPTFNLIPHFHLVSYSQTSRTDFTATAISVWRESKNGLSLTLSESLTLSLFDFEGLHEQFKSRIQTQENLENLLPITSDDLNKSRIDPNKALGSFPCHRVNTGCSHNFRNLQQSTTNSNQQ